MENENSGQKKEKKKVEKKKEEIQRGEWREQKQEEVWRVDK